MDENPKSQENERKIFDEVVSALNELSPDEIEDLNAAARKNMLLVDAIMRSLKGR